jgi:serine/threonine-protein kinase
LSVTAASIALVALVAFTVVTAVQSARVSRERDRAEQALARAEAVNQFLVGMFQQVDPRQSLGRPLTAEQMLQRAATRLQSDLKDEPLVRAHLLQSLADVYKQLGTYDLSEQLNEEAVDLRRQDAPLVLADSLDALGDVRRYAGRIDAAVSPLDEALSLRLLHLGERHRDVAETTNNLALVRHAQGRYAEAEALHRRAVAIWQEVGAREAGEDLVALGLTNLGRSVRAQGRSEEAAGLFERALRLRRERLAPDNPRIGTSLHFVALTRLDAGRVDEAARLFTEALRLRVAALGEAHPQTLQTRAQLARVQATRGDLATAAREAEATLVAGTTSPNTGPAVLAEAELVLAQVAIRAGDDADARARLERASTLVTQAPSEVASLRRDIARLEQELRRRR